MKYSSTVFWIKISCINFLLLALVGLLMRYKICFELSLFDQKQLQLAHSNFAFAGWVTQTLLVLMVQFLEEYRLDEKVVFYQNILIANVLVAYGSFFSFAILGYSFFSIIFSILTVIIGFVFAIHFYRDLNRIPKTISTLWFKAALFFMVISSIGTFSLAYMMATKHVVQHAYLASIYWYLHFQYNGWFYFAGVGLLLNMLKQYIAPSSNLRVTFFMFGISCLLTYLLSVLWLNLSFAWLILAFMAAAIQLWAWFRLFFSIKKPLLTFINMQNPILKYILCLIAIAVTIKFCLQLCSTIPIVSKLAFGFRPVVIAYLHLVLLAIISVFLIVFIWLSGYVPQNKFTITTIVFFVLMVYLNQLVLGIQGVASFANYYFTNMNELLLGIAFALVLSICLILVSMFKQDI